MEKIKLKNFYFALIVLAVILAMASAANDHVVEKDPKLGSIKDVKIEISKLLNKLNAKLADKSIASLLAQSIDQKNKLKARNRNLKSIFRIFNVNNRLG